MALLSKPIFSVGLVIWPQKRKKWPSSIQVSARNVDWLVPVGQIPIIKHLISSQVFHPLGEFLTMILFPRMQELQDHASTDCGWPQTSVYATSTLQSRDVIS